MAESMESTPSAAADTRRNLRAALLIQKICIADQRRVFFGYATNISCSGLFISSISPTPLGSRFTIEMTLPAPTELSIRCECETVWRRPYSSKSKLEPGMGLRFIDLDEQIKQKIDQWIQQHTTEPSSTPPKNS